MTTPQKITTPSKTSPKMSPRAGGMRGADGLWRQAGLGRAGGIVASAAARTAAVDETSCQLLARLRRRRERRGIVLVFVVVLLMLLAIMGTAYLTVSRADRTAVVSRGSLPGVTTPRVLDRSKLDEIFTASQRRLKNVIIEDLFNIAPGTLATQQDKAKTAGGTGTTAMNDMFAAFRQVAPSTSGSEYFYENYDAPGRADPWLSSLLPVQPDRTVAQYRWPFISAPINGTLDSEYTIDGFFSDPRYLTRGGFSDGYADQVTPTSVNAGLDVTERANAQVWAIGLLREDAKSADARNTRVYPGMRITRGGSGASDFIAGDADGDGIADGGLMPVVLNPNILAGAPNSIDRYLDAKNRVVYFVSYRIVDNSAMVNVNTALTAKGDFQNFLFRTGSGADIHSDELSQNDELRTRIGYLQVDAPNFGFFRSNVGLLELVRNTLEPYGSDPNEEALPYYREAYRLIDLRFPQLRSTPKDPAEGQRIRLLALPDDPNKTNPTAPAVQVVAAYSEGIRNTDDAANRAAFEFRTFGDMLEQQVARRPDSVGTLRWVPNGGNNPEMARSPFTSLPVADTLSWAARGSTLLNELVTAGDAETALVMSTRMSAPNFTAGSDATWRWFPPTEMKLWFDWSKDFAPVEGGDPDRPELAMLDLPVGQRTFRYTAPSGSGLKDVEMPRTIRSLLTTRSGISASVPQRKALPAGMPLYGDVNLARLPGAYPATRVAAATATKEQLWRGYFSAMTHNTSTGGSWGVNGFVENSSASAGSGLTFQAFLQPDRHASDDSGRSEGAPLTRLDAKQMAIIRSAVAACNTIDLRDNDQDITAMTVDLGAVSPDVPDRKVFGRVYGTEKQLVITAMVIDESDARRGGLEPYVAIEIFNPSNEPIDLRAYYVGIVERTIAADETLATGKITVPATGTSLMVPLTTERGSPQLLQPGGFLVMSNRGMDEGQTPAGIQVMAEKKDDVKDLQVLHRASVPQLTEVQRDNVEVALMRTRRADGVPSAENPLLADPDPVRNGSDYQRPAFTELTDVSTAENLLTLVPVDGVDMRSLAYGNSDPLDLRPDGEPVGHRYWYLRPTVPSAAHETTANELAWKCFYAGRFYDKRPETPPTTDGQTPRTPPVNPKAPPKDPENKAEWAWREFPSREITDATPVDDPIRLRELARGTLGRHRNTQTPALDPEVAEAIDASGTGTTEVPPFDAPVIPIQNFKPFTTFPAAPTAGHIDHAPNRFPYGSPFARNGDLLAVPFIGSYKIYRVPTTSAGSGRVTLGVPALYEWVPLTMDAVNVAPVPSRAVQNPSIGRFDARRSLISVAGGGGGTYSNVWADDLFDFVTARHAPAQMFFPDVPMVQANTTARTFNNPNDPLTDQDGPVVGFGATPANPQSGVPWVSWLRDGANTALSSARQGPMIKQDSSQLISGLINLNTAPPVVLRMLPWTVDDQSTDVRQGTLDQSPTNTAINAEMRFKVELIDRYLSGQKTPAVVEGVLAKKKDSPPWGFTSVTDIASQQAMSTTDPRLQQAAGTSDNQRLMRLGMLNPRYRPDFAHDFVAQNLTMTRVSNLVSQRSDVFTVYVTVQAWTWTGDDENQPTDTRLVGERRASFVVDRSRISETRFRPEDLLIYPVEQE